jgi:anti-sigma factor RsiW
MISCDSFRKRFAANTEDAALLAHLRTCDRCLDHAVSVDPDVLFRSLGGDDLLPPGGLDAFVGEVMQQVRVHETEAKLESRNVVSWSRRLAVAATLAAGITGAMLFSRGTASAPETQNPVAQARVIAPVTAQKLTTKPVVESYESENATIVEVPNESSDDIQIVMIFDENLPADL